MAYGSVKNVPAVRHLQHGLHLPVPGTGGFSPTGTAGCRKSLPVAQGKNPAPGDPRGQGLHRHRHRARLFANSPRTPRGM